MKKPLHEKGDMVIVSVMTNRSSISKMPVEPSRYSISSADWAPRCSIEKIKGEIIAVRTIRIDDKDPDYSYLVEFRYTKYGMGCMDNYCYTAWLSESDVHKPKDQQHS